MTAPTPTLEQTVERLAQRSANLYLGRYAGVVTDNKDDLKLARLKVKVPSVMKETEVGWARPSLPFFA